VGLVGVHLAVRKGLRPDKPAHGIVKFVEQRHRPRLTDDEDHSAWQGQSFLLSVCPVQEIIAFPTIPIIACS
jgi:hypothetical protein